jgi:hypothetical protein
MGLAAPNLAWKWLIRQPDSQMADLSGGGSLKRQTSGEINPYTAYAPADPA